MLRTSADLLLVELAQIILLPLVHAGTALYLCTQAGIPQRQHTELYLIMGRSADYSRQDCAIAATLSVVGEPWTLLIIRDAFKGIARFEQWQDSLGMARNVLAARLKHLVASGIFETKLYCERPKRYEYLLTDKGRELLPLLMKLTDWGRQHVCNDREPATGVISDQLNPQGQEVR